MSNTFVTVFINLC